MDPATPAQLAELKAYHQPIYDLAAIELILGPLLLIGTAFFLTRPLYALAARWAKRIDVPLLTRVWKGPEWAPTLIFALLYFGFFVLVNLPVEVWFGYVRERDFGLSTMSPGAFFLDALKHQALLVLSVTALAFGLFGLARRTRHWWWLVGGATSVALIGSIAMDPYRTRLYLDQAPLPAGALRTRLTAMLERASVPFSDIVVVQTGVKSVRVDAAFAGTGPTRTILLTDTLIASMSEAEVTAAVAHEAGHANEVRWPGRVLSPLAVFALMGFLEWLFRRSSQRGWFGITTRGDVRVLPLLVLAFDLSATLLMPLSASLTRGRELAADQFALQLTQDGDALASLLTKLGQINKVDPDPPRWYVLSGVSHPTVVERVAAIRAAEQAR